LLVGDRLNEASGDDDSLYTFVYELCTDCVCVNSADNVGLNPGDTDADTLCILDTLACSVFVDNTEVVAFALDDTKVVVEGEWIFDTLADDEGVCDSDT